VILITQTLYQNWRDEESELSATLDNLCGCHERIGDIQITWQV